MNQKQYYDITKEYPDMYRVTVYKNPYIPKQNNEKLKIKIPTLSDISDEFSIRRTKRTIHDYARCNSFDLFVTFTFSPKKVNRYDPEVCFARMQRWLFLQRRKSADFKYLIVPEKHKDGAIHFHAMMSGYPFELKKTRVIQDSRRVHNITAFRYGFTNATYIPDDDQNDRDKIANYICKYITKDMIKIHNKRRYWCSKNLQKPITHYNKIYDLGINSRLDHKSMIMETDYNFTYQIPKELL